jgi:hypothetical protein
MSDLVWSSVSDPNPDPPDPHVFGPPGPFYHQAKIVKKNFDSLCFVTSFGLLPLKNYVNVPSKSNNQKNIFFQISFVWRLEGQ